MQRSLRRDRRSSRSGRIRECGKEAIPLRPVDETALSHDRRVDQRVLLRENLGPSASELRRKPVEPSISVNRSAIVPTGGPGLTATPQA
jgi:hypothetical protein